MPALLGMALDGGDSGSGGAGGSGAGAGAGGSNGAAGAGGQSAGGSGGAAGGAAGVGGAAAASGGAGASSSAGAETNLGTYIDEKGGFKPGWAKALGLPDSFEAKFTRPEAAFRSHATLERTLGNQNKVAVPGPTATQEERDAFYKGIGRPDKPEEYGIKIPEKIGDKAFPKELWSEERAGTFAKTAHELGLTKAQVDGLIAYQGQSTLADFEGNQSARAKVHTDAVTALKTEWGQNYDANVALAEKGAAASGLSADVLKANPQLSNDPHFIRAMAKVGTMIGETPAAGARGSHTGTGDPGQKIAAIMSDKKHPYWVGNHPNHDAAVKEVAALYAQKSAG